MPETPSVITNIWVLKKILDDLDGLITWVESGFRQCKPEHGWTGSFTNFKQIDSEEISCFVRTIVSVNSPAFLALNQFHLIETEAEKNNYVDFSNP